MHKPGLCSQGGCGGIRQPHLPEYGWQGGVIDAKSGVQQLILKGCLRALCIIDPSLSLELFLQYMIENSIYLAACRTSQHMHQLRLSAMIDMAMQAAQHTLQAHILCECSPSTQCPSCSPKPHLKRLVGFSPTFAGFHQSPEAGVVLHMILPPSAAAHSCQGGHMRKQLMTQSCHIRQRALTACDFARQAAPRG